MKGSFMFNIYENDKNEMILRDFLATDRTILANERTFLAYIRTALSLIVSGASFIKFFDISIINKIGYAFIYIGFIIIYIGFLRFLKINKKLKKVQY
jgi:putative membrane protein